MNYKSRISSLLSSKSWEKIYWQVLTHLKAGIGSFYLRLCFNEFEVGDECRSWLDLIFGCAGIILIFGCRGIFFNFRDSLSQCPTCPTVRCTCTRTALSRLSSTRTIPVKWTMSTGKWTEAWEGFVVIRGSLTCSVLILYFLIMGQNLIEISKTNHAVRRLLAYFELLMDFLWF